MKKYYGIIIALLVLIGVVLTPSRVSADNTQDLVGKVYKVTTKAVYHDKNTKDTKSISYWAFGDNGKILECTNKQLAMVAYKNKDLINDLIESEDIYKENSLTKWELDGNHIKVFTNDNLTLADSIIENGVIKKYAREYDGAERITTYKEVSFN